MHVGIAILAVFLLGGVLSIALLVQGLRASRDDEGLGEQRASVADERARRAAAGRAPQARASVAHAEARVITFPVDPIETSMYELAEYGQPIYFEQQIRR